MTYIPSETRYETMSYRRCGRSGLLLPAISLGLWHNFGNITPFSTQQEILRTAFDHGITHFDLANNYGPPYGEAERNFGEHMRRDWKPHRDELILSTKAGYDMWKGPYGNWGSKKYLIASLDQSLRRMHVEYVDIFYHHRPDPETPIEETMGALDQIVRSGKALYSVDRTIGETGEPYGDGTHIVHVSASLADSSTELGRLMHDLKCTEPEAMFYNELRERTGFFKKDEGRVYMATEFEEMLEEIARERVAKARNEKIAEERAEGRRENARDAARRMIADGSIPLDKVAEFSGLPLSEVEGIRNGISL